VLELIGATTTKTGLKAACVLDERTYQKGIKVSNAEMRALAITGNLFHPLSSHATRSHHFAECPKAGSLGQAGDPPVLRNASRQPNGGRGAVRELLPNACAGKRGRGNHFNAIL